MAKETAIVIIDLVSTKDSELLSRSTAATVNVWGSLRNARKGEQRTCGSR